MTKITDHLHQAVQEPGPVVKLFNYVAATLGIGTFLGLVNMVVGVLSALWLGVQLYGYMRYELPKKRAELKAALKALEESKL